MPEAKCGAVKIAARKCRWRHSRNRLGIVGMRGELRRLGMKIDGNGAETRPVAVVESSGIGDDNRIGGMRRRPAPYCPAKI